MFLTALQKQNPLLIETAIALWQSHAISPDSYVIDVDSVEQNARQFLQLAQQYHLTPYVMTKQFGRNPWLCQRLIELGYSGAVAVDFKEARQLARHKIPLAHVGHLVQLPESEIAPMLALHPQEITVFSVAKAQSIAEQARKQGIQQALLLKVYHPDDVLYPGQEGGFTLDELPQAAEQIAALLNVNIIGVTHFPCLLCAEGSTTPYATPNFTTLLTAAEQLHQQGFDIQHINAPSASSCTTLPLLAQLGATHVEPGHAFTGTIPANIHGDQPERLAMLYLSEISHHYLDNSLCFGGGYYRRGHLYSALVITPQGNRYLTSVQPPADDSIDYHLSLRGHFPIGSAVLMCFRTQIFVTRSDVAMVCHIRQGNPTLAGVFDSQGNRLNKAIL
jgi:predicted amino acid racemase